MGLKTGSPLVRRATNVALYNVFKSKERSGNFKFCRYFTWSDNNRNSRETWIPEVEGKITILLFSLLTVFTIFASKAEINMLQLSRFEWFTRSQLFRNSVWFSIIINFEKRAFDFWLVRLPKVPDSLLTSVLKCNFLGFLRHSQQFKFNSMYKFLN